MYLLGLYYVECMIYKSGKGANNRPTFSLGFRHTQAGSCREPAQANLTHLRALASTRSAYVAAATLYHPLQQIM